MLSKKAEILQEYMKSEYIENGYIYSGCVGFNQVSTLLNTTSPSEVNNVFCKLQMEDLIQKRNCDGFAYELTINERKNLIDKYDLSKVWEEKAPYFYPNSEHGEITKVNKLTNL